MAATPLDGPEFSFIKSARDLILKEGSFKSYATRTESGTGEGRNHTVTREDYDLAYYVDGVRRDLLVELKGAVAWCRHELESIEAQLDKRLKMDSAPPRFRPGNPGTKRDKPGRT